MTVKAVHSPPGLAGYDYNSGIFCSPRGDFSSSSVDTHCTDLLLGEDGSFVDEPIPHSPGGIPLSQIF